MIYRRLFTFFIVSLLSVFLLGEPVLAAATPTPLPGYRDAATYMWIGAGAKGTFSDEQIAQIGKRYDMVIITKSHAGWNRNKQTEEAGSTVEVCCLAYKITKEKKYKDMALKAFDWYHGKNVLGAEMVNQKTGGVYDGLEKEGVNLNQGAESILSYLLAWVTIRDLF